MALCICGCGGETKTTWVRGHHSRVNNISKRPDIREKRKQKMQEWHDSGCWQPWNKGLSDERTKANGQAVALARGEEWKKNVSQSMLKNRQTFTKDKHPAWKGGTSSLIHRLRASHKLYGEWKYPILKRDNFSCQDCGLADGKLNVHHDKETMSEIMQKFVSKFNKPKTFEENSVIIDAIVQYHIDNNVSGIALCKPCHKKRHSETQDSD